MKLKDVAKLIESPEEFDWYVTDNRHCLIRYKVEFYEEASLSWSPEKFFLAGFEYGATHLIHACNESDAYECWIDLLPTVPIEEVHEAYNSFDKLLEHMESKGHENDHDLRGFCNRWCKFYFEVDTKDANMTGAWDRWELDESYSYQSNSTGTGIVEIGHYAWMNEIPIDRIEVESKAEVTA